MRALDRTFSPIALHTETVSSSSPLLVSTPPATPFFFEYTRSTFTALGSGRLRPCSWRHLSCQQYTARRWCGHTTSS